MNVEEVGFERRFERLDRIVEFLIEKGRGFQTTGPTYIMKTFMKNFNNNMHNSHGHHGSKRCIHCCTVHFGSLRTGNDDLHTLIVALNHREC